MSCHNTYQLDPGPLDRSVLTGQQTHRSRDIWDGHDNMVLNTRKCDGKFWNLVKEHSVPPRVLDVIIQAGLYGVYRSYRPSIDRSLITALVERWRPETHTFHFKNGEATITLQDVEVLYGLSVDGDAVIGYEPTRTIEEWQDICTRLLGFTPRREDFKYSKLKVSALNAHMVAQPILPDGATEETVYQKARCYMFWMIAGMLMADTSGSMLKLIYLPMLEDVDRISAYSWGTATLACLYRNLCKASQSNSYEIAGFLPLLQVWALERITILRPKVVGQRDTTKFFPETLPKGPHAVNWIAHFSWTETTQYVLSVFRDALDSMTEEQFIWEPYSEGLIESLPEFCRAGRHVWRARVPIFCWDVVEIHLADRVMRQFGLIQDIPQNCVFDASHFNKDRRGKQNTHWEQVHEEWLPFWNNRQQYVCDAPTCQGPLQTTDSYFNWFRRITRFLIGNPRPQQQQGYVPNSTPFEAMVRHIHATVDKAKSLGDEPTLEEFYIFRAMVRDKGSSCLDYVHEASRLHEPADYNRSELTAEHLRPPIHRRGRGGVTGRRARFAESGGISSRWRDPSQQASDDQIPDCEDGSTSEVHNEDFSRASGSDAHVGGCDIGSMEGVNTQDFTQESNMSYQTPDAQIMPLMTPSTANYSMDQTFENDYGTDFFADAPPHFRGTPRPLSVHISDVRMDDEDGNQLEDVNDDGDGNNDLEGVNNIDGNNVGDITQVNERPKRIKIPKRCGTGSHYLYQHGRSTKK